jgi:hypothetical protein
MGALGQGPGGEMSNARGDIPREVPTYYPGGSDPIRGNSPYTPVSGNSGGAPQVPVLGLVILAGIVLAFEHFRKGR